MVKILKCYLPLMGMQPSYIQLMAKYFADRLFCLIVIQGEHKVFP